MLNDIADESRNDDETHYTKGIIMNRNDIRNIAEFHGLVYDNGNIDVYFGQMVIGTVYIGYTDDGDANNVAWIETDGTLPCGRALLARLHVGVQIESNIFEWMVSGRQPMLYDFTDYSGMHRDA
jgi:hypothetical protein